MAMTLFQIMKKTELGRQDRATLTKVVSLRYGISKKTGFPKAVAKVYSKKSGEASGTHYGCAVTCQDEKSHVKISCSCPDFVFSGSEYLLYKQGAADLIYGNGEPPVSKPDARPGACKHLVSMFKELHSQGKLNQKLEFKE